MTTAGSVGSMGWGLSANHIYPATLFERSRMKLEPVAWIGQDAFAAITGGETICQTLTPSQTMYDDICLYAIPEGYKVVPVESTPEMNFAGYDACQRVSTVQVGLATIAAIYKAMIEGEQ